MGTGPETMRLFIAVRLPDHVRRAIEQFQSEVRDTLRGSDIRWIRPEQFHLTLKFLGNVRNPDLGELEERLKTACDGFSALNLRAEKAGCFPNSRRPRVIWVGVTDTSGQLERLHAAVEQAVSGLTGEEPAEQFAGHLTLGRVKTMPRHEVDSLSAISSRSGAKRFGDWQANSIALMRSELSPKGATHACVRSFRLGKDPVDYSPTRSILLI